MLDELDVLLGRSITSIEGIDNDYIYITLDNGDCFAIYHSQDCCESVGVYDTIGNVADVIGSPVLGADINHVEPEGIPEDTYYDSHTWTVYTITTAKGSFVIRWLGQSNGYYGECPYFVRSHARI
jgi:hypothetical protein